MAAAELGVPRETAAKPGIPALRRRGDTVAEQPAPGNPRKTAYSCAARSGIQSPGVRRPAECQTQLVPLPEPMAASSR